VAVGIGDYRRSRKCDRNIIRGMKIDALVFDDRLCNECSIPWCFRCSSNRSHDSCFLRCKPRGNPDRDDLTNLDFIPCSRGKEEYKQFAEPRRNNIKNSIGK
jgi:hypothetical protein